ncbi:MAG: hypothetical protein K0R54_6008 [Clostridiaceae bacterium]|jgi:hypothetical protein|nr:hypothetical protein [Clostridiaceae bacterium]
MIKKFNKFLCFALMFLFCVTPISAFAAQLPQGAILVEDDGYDRVYIASDDIVDVDAYIEELDIYIEELSRQDLQKNSSSSMAIAATTPYTIGDSSTETIANNTATGTASFDSTIYWDYIESSEIDGDSYARYSGIYGHYPDSISLTDKFSFVGVVVSVSADGPNWSTSGDTAIWSRTMTGTNVLNHYYSGVTCVGYDLYIKQQTTAEFEVGSNAYTIIASDSQFL